jgi:ribosomal protein S18 acetylase RimI-like enzyme
VTDSHGNCHSTLADGGSGSPSKNHLAVLDFCILELHSRSDLRSYFDIHYTETCFLSLFSDPLTQVFVTERDDHIVGYNRSFFNREGKRPYVPSLYLLPDFQGQEIGIRLLKTAEEYAAQKSFDELWIGVMVANRKALLFYRKAGFQFVREEPFTMG